MTVLIQGVPVINTSILSNHLVWVTNIYVNEITVFPKVGVMLPSQRSARPLVLQRSLHEEILRTCHQCWLEDLTGA